MNSTQEPDAIPTMPENFRSTITDFTKDLSTTFPEFTYLWAKWSNPATPDTEFIKLFTHCLVVYPERFFDILNQNAEIFDVESTTNTMFLPNVEFKMLYHCGGVSENTRQTIWKYLQVILFLLVGSMKDKVDFGEAANLFSGIDETDLQEKLKDVMANIGEFFSQTETSEETAQNQDATANEESKGSGQAHGPGEGQPHGLPNPKDLQDHLHTLFNGKIGTLAKELAEDLGQDLAEAFGQDDMGSMKSTKDVFSKLMQNPQKISGLVKTVGEKLNQKMAAGDISQEDIMGEAGELMRKMKDMGGAGQFADMFKSMAKGMGLNIPKGAKLNMNALNEMEKKMSATEKMRARAQMKRQKKMEEEAAMQAQMKKQYEDYHAFMLQQQMAAAAAASATFPVGTDKQELSNLQIDTSWMDSPDPSTANRAPAKKKKKGKK